MKQERGLSQNQGLGYRYNYRLLNQNWLERKLKKMKTVSLARQWRDEEISAYRMTLHGVRSNGEFSWQ